MVASASREGVSLRARGLMVGSWSIGIVEISTVSLRARRVARARLCQHEGIYED